MKKTFIIDDVEDILTFINTNIKKHKLKKNEENRASLMAEEMMLCPMSIRSTPLASPVSLSLTAFTMEKTSSTE